MVKMKTRKKILSIVGSPPTEEGVIKLDSRGLNLLKRVNGYWEICYLKEVNE